ncbi:MAG: BatA domain-containing protein [Pirellulales bacterium]
MNFGLVQTAFLLALAGLAIPLLIHFTFRSRPRTVDVGSIRFLREILERSRNRKKVMRWLLLSLRMVCVGLLALLFARPYLTDRTSGSAGRFMAVLIDDSASMRLNHQGRPLLDRALSEAQRLIDDADDDTRIEVAFFNQDVAPFQSSASGTTSDARSTQDGRGSLREMLKRHNASYAVTDYAAALRWANDVCAKSTARRKEVHLFTDLQQSGLAWSEAPLLPKDIAWRIHDLGRELVNNVAITAAVPSRLVVRPGGSAEVTASVFNSGPFTLEDLPVALELRQSNRPIAMQQRIKLAAGATQEVRFELPPLTEGLWQGAISLEALDDLAFDNRRHIAILSAPAWPVLLVDGDSHEKAFQRETYFLDLALRLAVRSERSETSQYAPQTVAVPEGELPDLASFSVAVLANVADMQENDVRRLAQFVRSGGGLIVFGGPRLSRESSLVDAGLIPGTVAPNRLAGDLPFRLREWDAAHSILRAFDDPQHGDLRGLTFRGYTPLVPAKGAQVLARFYDQAPALVEQSLGKGRVLWFASACDLEWSEWARGPLFVPLVHQMLGYLTGLNEGGPVRMTLVNVGKDSAGARAPGVFQQDGYWQVVNVDPRESETDRSTVDDFAKRFGVSVETNEAEDPVLAASTGAVSLQFRQNEIWHWIIVALVGLVALEFFLANRATA